MNPFILDRLSKDYVCLTLFKGCCVGTVIAFEPVCMHTNTYMRTRMYLYTKVLFLTCFFKFCKTCELSGVENSAGIHKFGSTKSDFALCGIHIFSDSFFCTTLFIL